MNSKKKKRKNKTRKTKRKYNKKYNKSKFNYELHYFKMNKCKWCIEFQKTILKKLFKIKNLKIKILLVLIIQH